MSWIQANSKNPCPICGKNHYCTMNPHGGVVKCTRVQEGSFKQQKDRAGFGYFHRHDFSDPDAVASPRLMRTRAQSTLFQWADLVAESKNAPWAHMASLSRKLHIPAKVLSSWNVGWLSQRQLKRYQTYCKDRGAWTFPMYDHHLSVVGVRLRSESGMKFAVKGSSNGLFMHPTGPRPGRVLIVDGASDAISAWSRHINVIGLPSCTSGKDELLQVVSGWGIDNVEIILDNDDYTSVHAQNARSYAIEMLDECPRGMVFYPPKQYKDLRQWLQEHDSLPNRLSRLERSCGNSDTNSQK